jgi:4-methyl-5(b-hydroxyethyl)-thiazole monophosphate biosynthesis
MTRIAVHFAEGFEETEGIAVVDMLRRAGMEVDMVSVTGDLKVTGSHNIPIITDVLFEDVDYNNVDMLILPGGMPGTRNLQSHGGLREQLQRFYQQDKYIGAICAAPLILGYLGILQDKKATCYPGFEAELTGAEVSCEYVEQAGKIVTGKGVGVAIDFALKIIEMLAGKELAEDLSKKCIVKS